MIYDLYNTIWALASGTAIPDKPKQVHEDLTRLGWNIDGCFLVPVRHFGWRGDYDDGTERLSVHTEDSAQGSAEIVTGQREVQHWVQYRVRFNGFAPNSPINGSDLVADLVRRGLGKILHGQDFWRSPSHELGDKCDENRRYCLMPKKLVSDAVGLRFVRDPEGTKVTGDVYFTIGFCNAE